MGMTWNGEVWQAWRGGIRLGRDRRGKGEGWQVMSDRMLNLVLFILFVIIVAGIARLMVVFGLP